MYIEYVPLSLTKSTKSSYFPCSCFYPLIRSLLKTTLSYLIYENKTIGIRDVSI